MTTSTIPISLGGTSSPVSVAQELLRVLTAPISLNETDVRRLAGASAGSSASGTAISLSALQNKTFVLARVSFVAGSYAGSVGIGSGFGTLLTSDVDPVLGPSAFLANALNNGGAPFGTTYITFDKVWYAGTPSLIDINGTTFIPTSSIINVNGDGTNAVRYTSPAGLYLLASIGTTYTITVYK